jgi:hypothetical protein
MQTTGNAGGSHNLLVQPGRHDLKGPVARNGHRPAGDRTARAKGVNYVTGDYSRGAAGYWVEKGEIAYPVEEITIAGNLREMLRGIVAIGNDIEASRLETGRFDPGRAHDRGGELSCTGVGAGATARSEPSRALAARAWSQVARACSQSFGGWR